VYAVNENALREYYSSGTNQRYIIWSGKVCYDFKGGGHIIIQIAHSITIYINNTDIYFQFEMSYILPILKLY